MAEQSLPRTLAVIGAGTMGGGIAQVGLQAGLRVILYDVAPAGLTAATERIAAGLERAAARGRLAEPPAAFLARLRTTTELRDAGAAEFVIEAAPENPDLKRRIFAELDQACPPETILATNTSSLPVTAIAAAVRRPERVVGMHFFNPVPAMKLVEVIPGRGTAAETVARTMALARALGKEPVQAGDTPGFIVNRVARPFYGEALRLVTEGVATPEQVDRAMVAAGFRMGPFALMDLIGIDVNLAVSESVYGQFFGEPRFRPQLLQARMVQSGWLGRKSGRGFYDYRDAGATGPAPGAAASAPAASAPGAAPGATAGSATGAAAPGTPWPGAPENPVLLIIDDPTRPAAGPLAAAAGAAGLRLLTLTPEAADSRAGVSELPPGLVAVLDLAVPATDAAHPGAAPQAPGAAAHSGAEARWERLLALEQRLGPEVPVLVAHPGGPVTPLAAMARRPERLLALGGLPPYGAGGVVEVGLPLQARAGERAGWGPVPEAPGLPPGQPPGLPSGQPPGQPPGLPSGQPPALPPGAATRAGLLFDRLGLTPLWLADSPGLVAGRILACLINEAAYALMEGVAAPGDIDRAMELGTGYPRGPLAWGDGLGLPFVLDLLAALHRDSGEERHRPAPLLRRLVQAGAGFYPG